MAMSKWRVVLAAVFVVAVATSGDRARACLFSETIILVNIVRPADPEAFDRGVLGVIQPTYERRFLIRAYRRFHGLDAVFEPSPALVAQLAGAAQPLGWLEARERVLKTGQKIDAWRFQKHRPLADYRVFENCGYDAFQTATSTLEERVRQFGAESPVVAAWLRAQDAVFGNCGGSATVQVVMPEPAPPVADAMTRADRAYQTAAAYFYAMKYDDAESRFLAIAEDKASPWRPYGRYLAARSLIRRQSVGLPTLTKQEGTAVLDRADRHLEAIANDSSAPAGLRESATGLRFLIASRARSTERFRELATLLTAPGRVGQQRLTDYLLLFDSSISPDTEYDYDKVVGFNRLAEKDDLTDWVLALQGTGIAARDRAVARWSETRSTHWLVAALWKVSASDSAADALLRAAGEVPADSPAYMTVAFLRTRLLLARGDRTGARSVLASLPDQQTATMQADSVNLFRALRLQAADDLNSWLRAAPRFPSSSGQSFGTSGPVGKPIEPSFDVDAALALTESFPLDRLVEAVATPILPPRLRLIVASEAWTRAVQLRRDDAGLRVAPVIKELAPALRAEMDRYVGASTPEARHYAGVLTVLRWPTFRNYVPLAEGAPPGFFPPRFTEPSQTLDLGIRKHWWCGFGPMRTWTVSGPYEETPVTRLPELVYQAARIPPPAVISVADRAQATREFDALAGLGTAPNYLSGEVIAWAKASPKDPDVAEALARAVASTKYGCGDKQTGAFSRQAFTILHRQYPATEWAKRTKYWYSDQY
jgi:hypothetical protein